MSKREPRGKTDWHILRKVAELSPKSYARQIKRRNVALLRLLEKGESGMVEIGCPHCEKHQASCGLCPWKPAVPKKQRKGKLVPCVAVFFGGVRLADVGNYGRDVGIDYATTWAAISLHTPNPTQHASCRRFLERHIEWAEKPWWGKKYRKGAK